MEGREFKIPSSNLSKFQERWEKLVRRANKLGITPPSYTIVKETPQVHQVKRERFNELKNIMETYMEDMVVMCHHVVIEHPLVKVAGWNFVASLEHTEEGNVVHNISGEDLPAEYRDCDAQCDHCQTKRNRKDTFVVRSETDYKQIGSSCLSDFLGVDGTMFALSAELYHTANELGEASEGESWGGGGALYDYLDAFLSHVAEVISVNGWLSRKMANEYQKPSTSDIAQRHMHPGPYDKREDRLYDHPSEKSIDLAKQAIDWCDSLSDEEVKESEYLHNIRIIARRGVVGSKQYGYAASIIAAYQRTLTERINKERQEKTKSVSQYVGEVGKRQNFTVMVEKVLALESAYGTSHMHIMTEVPSGNRLTWFSTGKVFDTGVILNIKATPKKFEEYKGTRQTILTRCQIVE